MIGFLAPSVTPVGLDSRPKPPVKVDWVTVTRDRIASRQEKVRNVDKGSSEALFTHLREPFFTFLFQRHN